MGSEFPCAVTGSTIDTLDGVSIPVVGVRRAAGDRSSVPWSAAGAEFRAFFRAGGLTSVALRRSAASLDKSGHLMYASHISYTLGTH